MRLVASFRSPKYVWEQWELVGGGETGPYYATCSSAGAKSYVDVISRGAYDDYKPSPSVSPQGGDWGITGSYIFKRRLGPLINELGEDSL